MKTRTASTDLQNGYYGLPVIKAPHWGWYIINYFFLGGLAGAAALIGALNDLFGRNRSITRAARYVSLAAVLPSPVLLTLDLGRPERALNMFRVLKLKSPMSLGSWALLNLGFGAALLATFQLLEDFFHVRVPRGVSRAVSVLTMPFGLFVSGYTGVLLAATNVPLWARNYLLLGPTFVASAFSTALSAMALFLHFENHSGESTDGELNVLRTAERTALGTELVLLMAGVLRLGRLGHPLTTGRYGKLFWPVVVGAGVLAPFGLLSSNPRPSRSARVASVLALIGGFTLRALIVFAGRESAKRPHDYFEYTRRRSQ